MAKAVYRCTALVGVNKKGIVKADPDGYYDVILGAFDYYNTNGAFYAFEPAKKLLEESSILMRRVRKGVLHGERGHPKQLPGMSEDAFIRRALAIDETNISHHIKDIEIDSENVVDKSGKKIIAVRGRIKPFGPGGADLAASLENPHQNTCFSIRSFTTDVHEGLLHVKNVIEIITWDWVVEPGLAIANKFDFPSMEDFSPVYFKPEHFAKAFSAAQQDFNKGFEDAGIKNDINHLMQRFGYNKAAGLILPADARW